MTKRITTLILAVIFPITLIFSGCGKRMTKEEYIETVKGWQAAFYDAVERESNTLNGCENLSGEKLLEFYKKNKPAFNAIQDDMEKIYREVKNTAAPEEYSEQHEKLKEAADKDLEYLKLERQLCDAKDLSELTEAQDKLAAYIEARGEYVMDPRSFTTIMYNIIRKADGM